MNAWLSDAATANITNHDNGAFTNNPTIDPSMAFLHQSPTSADPAQFQRMFNNGAPQTISPGFHNPNSVIPSKRPRPDDGMSMSPRLAPGGLPNSRSHTPQVPYPGYQGQQINGASQFPQPQHAPTPYQHLQPGGSANASPSPILPEFDQQAVQRVQTASPSPFSPAGIHVGPQISPSHSDHGSRVNTPQNSPFPPGQPYGQVVGSHFSPSPAMTSAGIHPAMQAQFNQSSASHLPQGFPHQPQQQQQQPPQQPPPPQQQQQMSSKQRPYQIRLQNQARQMQAVASPVSVGRPIGPGGTGQTPMQHPHMATMRQIQQNMAKPTSQEGFLQVLQRFWMSRGHPQVNLTPVVSGRPLNLMQLYATVMKMGGSKKIIATNLWPVVAQQLQFPAMQYPTAAQEIREHYMNSLAQYEQAWLSSQQKQFTDQMHGSSQRDPLEGPLGINPQMSPAKPMGNHSFDMPMTQQFSPVSAQNQQVQSHNHAPPIPVNGFATPSQSKSQQQKHTSHQQRSSLSRPPESMSPNGRVAQFSASPIQVEKKPSPVVTKSQPGSGGMAGEELTSTSWRRPIEDTFKPAVFPESQYHGPIIVDEMFQLGEEIIRLKPNVPSFLELGVIDIHALTMSIKSGIHAEMRMALDTLTEMSNERSIQVSLDNCEDLVEALVECAEEQAELLAENAAEVSDVMLFPSYEEVFRGCRQEMEALLDVPEFGSLDYELDRAVDRLICITTIIRNFSFAESNLASLGMPFVVRFISTIIRYLGTRNMLLRTHQNTLDFMKDAVIYLSNLSHSIQLPGKDEALCLLHFLLSFAPTPVPTSFGNNTIMFTPYNPSIHKYMPAAVDSLAKLLARDDPNRTYYKAIFAQDCASSPPYELLTRTLGLSIAAIPKHMRGNIVGLVDARKPLLMQGMLAAEILSGFADNTIARSWLESTDGFATSLLRLACLLSIDRTAGNASASSVTSSSATAVSHRHGSHPGARAAEVEFHGYGSITSRALATLVRLARKSRMADSTSGGGNNNAGGSGSGSGNGSKEGEVPLGVLPKKENLLGALLTPNIDPNVVRQLCEYAGLGG
ncbi:conserved hypothetical protein [Histoplasma capsulatum G186AR]|uniref:ARID domain-containing protein n=2 Tax=Ajellomyces capsulatus TaxID=5037 RepID=C0NV18_AJECG|nr:uncharacterized protein HCBG_06782 [Histoplasma capsulatum G186AR]EEH04831.1 conserved hypothetical protein [Histoplasma capsulatum G186AR]KAG5287488.1 ARID/BRIGHT domain protein (SWI1) [Histoplasma capsulatum]QSS70699.1 ARID/BRIGHT domain protein (SWI1) [Histoplasma capsulatum G186AR]